MWKKALAFLVAAADISFYFWVLDFDRTVEIPTLLAGPLFMVFFVSLCWAAMVLCEPLGNDRSTSSSENPHHD